MQLKPNRIAACKQAPVRPLDAPSQGQSADACRTVFGRFGLLPQLDKRSGGPNIPFHSEAWKESLTRYPPAFANLKSVLTREIHLTMPSVVDGSDYSLRICGAEMRDRLAFECAEGLFWVTTVHAIPRRSRLEPDARC
jgi:hypothetical protein